MTFIDELLESELKKPTVFTDESVFDNSHLPEKLPFREEQLKQLIHHFRSLLTSSTPSPNHVILYGPVGVGKTTTMQLFGLMILEKTRKNITRNFQYVHINCRRYRRSSYQALKAILNEIWGPMSPRGYSLSELVEMLESILKKRRMHLLIVLDEAEYLLRHDADLLNLLVKLKDSANDKERKNMSFGISIALIIRHQHLETILDVGTISSLKRNYINFPPYDKRQLTEILKLRAKKGLKPGAIDDKIIEMIASIAALKGGDCRLALELLLRSGKLADEDGSEVITSEHVKKSVVSVYQVEKDIIRSLDDTKKFILRFLISTFKKHEPLDLISLSDLWSNYKEFCIKKSLPFLTRAKFKKHLQDLSKLGLISLQHSTVAKKGFVRLALDLPLSELDVELSLKE